MDEQEFWKKEFGNKTTAKDFHGREVNKYEYASGKNDSWTIDHIQPLSKNGKDTEDNKQIVNCKTNEEKGNKTTFDIDDVFYQVKRTKNIKKDDKLANYNYSKKKYSIVILED